MRTMRGVTICATDQPIAVRVGVSA